MEKILKVQSHSIKIEDFNNLLIDLKQEFYNRYKNTFYQWSDYFILLISDLWISKQQDEFYEIEYSQFIEEILESIDYLLKKGEKEE